MSKIARWFTSEAQRYAILGAAFGFLFPVLATLIRITNSGLPSTLSNALAVQSGDTLLWIIDTAPFFLGLFAALAGRRQDHLLQLNAELMQRESDLESIRANLEQRVEERTRELTHANQQITRRAEQLELVASVARSIISIRDVDQLLTYIAQAIGQSFGFYHVAIFLLDERRQFASLRATNSEGGSQMRRRGYRLKVGEGSLVGYVAQSGAPRIASDVGLEAMDFNSPDLPDTHAELALPLKSGGVIIGALDIQSTVSEAFNQEDMATLSILADQVATVIQNAVTSERADRALREAEVSTQQATKQFWSMYVEKLQSKGYRYDGIKPEAMKEAKPIPQETGVLLVPVKLRGQVIGRLKLRPADPSRRWSEDEQAIIAATAERVALALDGARLLEEARKRASRESLLSDIGAKLGGSLQIDSILRDTVQELGQALKDSTVSFQLVNPSAPPSRDLMPSNGQGLSGKKLD
jgi:GAF domain-containing protein